MKCFNFLPNNKKNIEFDRLILESKGCDAGSHIFEVSKVVNSIVLEYYIKKEIWDNVQNNYNIEKHVIRSVRKSINDYEQICDILSKLKVNRWNGFNKINKNVLDGNSFNFKLYYQNEILISAHGVNATPKDFYLLKKYLNEFILTERINNEKFENDCFSCLLPINWINNIFIRYSDEYVSFFLKINENEKTIFIIYFLDYEIKNEYQFIGTLIKGSRKKYLYATYKVIDDIEIDIKKDSLYILNTLRAANKYKLIKEKII